MTASAIALEDRYTATSGRVYMTGIQALVRLPMSQMRRDRAAGLNTAAYVTGYRGSPLGGYDLQLIKARPHLDAHGVVFQPGLNEDLAATAIWGSQQVGLSPGATKEGVVGIWYGKGPGVDRSGDVLKHGNAAGSSAKGGVLCLAGDDHTCKSSTVPHQSDHDFMSALMPVLYPSSIHEFLEIGLLGVAMSRYSGCWVGMKFIADTVETTSVVDLAGENRRFAIPDDFELPPGGLNLRWPDPPLLQDERLQEKKGYAAIAFARANGVDEQTFDCEGARFGIVGSGKAYEDVRQALHELGIGHEEAREIGIRLYKVRMPWPLEPVGIRRFSEGLEEVLIVEERREIIENQIKQQLFNWRADVRPRIVGKFDETDRPFLSLSRGLTVGALGRAIATRLLAFDFDPGLRERIAGKLAHLEARGRATAEHDAPVIRLPHYCAGCPHNTSTRVPEGSRALAGIGCHYMVQWMDRRTETFTQMGGEGVPWTAIRHFTDEKHVFANLGDGTYFHSGLLAIRQSVASGAAITYKILYNDAVAMTGGQPIDGQLTPQQITHQLFHEGVKPIYLLSDQPELYKPGELAPGVIVRHRDHIDPVMEEIREQPGCSAILYVQTCAAEKRRRRKRGLMEDPAMRVAINPAVCEGCGDCSVQSNCIAVEPLETEFGRKRQINQSACNKDFSCLKGFCPSFVTVRGAEPKKRAAIALPDLASLPEPKPAAIRDTVNIAVTGVGGTGVLTIGALLAMAAHIEGKSPMVLDMAGLAQKGGAVMSHIRINPPGRPVTSPRIANGRADLLIAADSVVAASKDGIALCDHDRTEAILNARITPVSDFIRNRDFDFRQAAVEGTVRKTVRSDAHFHDFSALALALIGDEIAANILMVGYAQQKGLLPLEASSIERAIEINGVAIEANRTAFRWGRVIAHDPGRIRTLIGEDTAELPQSQDAMSLDALIDHRKAHLSAYQGKGLVRRYDKLLGRLEAALDTRAIRPDLAQRLMRAAAQNYAKLLSYKDEYEVARLYARPEFKAWLDDQFEGPMTLAFNLAPPMLPGTDPIGRPKKREFGAWILPVFRVLAAMRFLRGTPFDPFGMTAERRAERALIRQYEADVDLVGERLDEATIESAIELLNLPDRIRGFGPVKKEAMAAVAPRRLALREAIRTGDRAPAAKAA